MTQPATLKLEEITDDIDRHGSSPRAAYVLNQIERAFRSRSKHPRRGRCPTELPEIGFREYREVFFMPYLIIYRVVAEMV